MFVCGTCLFASLNLMWMCGRVVCWCRAAEEAAQKEAEAAAEKAKKKKKKNRVRGPLT